MNAIPTMSAIDEVEIVDLANLSPNGVRAYWEAAAEAGATRARLQGPEAEQVVELWNALPAGEQARCHLPPFGLRFFSQGQLLLEATLCWQCDNIYGTHGATKFAYEFDGSARGSVKLLSLARNAIHKVKRASPKPHAETEQPGPTGVGGWLIIPMLGLASNAFTSVKWLVVPRSRHLLADDKLTLGEQALYGAGAVAAITLLGLMLRESRWFPRGYIAFLLMAMVGKLIYFGEGVAGGFLPGFDLLTLRALATTFLMPAVWIPYMLKSRRVANTFVK